MLAYKERCSELLNDGHTWKDIARIVGIHRNTGLRYCKKWKLQPRLWVNARANLVQFLSLLDYSQERIGEMLGLAQETISQYTRIKWGGVPQAIVRILQPISGHSGRTIKKGLYEIEIIRPYVVNISDTHTEAFEMRGKCEIVKLPLWTGWDKLEDMAIEQDNKNGGVNNGE